MLSFGLQKHQPYLFTCFQTSKYVRRTLIHAFLLLKRWCVCGLFLFNGGKHRCCLALSFLTTTVHFSYCLFEGFSELNTYTVPCLFIYGVHKPHYYMWESTLTSKKISATLFVVCLSLNMFFVPFSCILTWKYINHTYPVAVYTLNTRLEHLIVCL